MSKEMVGEKLSGDQGPGPESPPIVTETNKGKREGLILVFLTAVGIGILVLASVFLLPYVSSLGGSILGGTSSTTTYSGSAVPEASADLPPSFIATDGGGNEISDGVATSGQITISGYSDSAYSTELRCSIDTLPVYCNGSPITITGLPHGTHKFSIAETGSDETVVLVLNWKVV
jgi:hypothetical protein